nr:unnamed protein product [Callosobruchus analis]
MDSVNKNVAIYGTQSLWTFGCKVKWINGNVVKIGTPLHLLLTLTILLLTFMIHPWKVETKDKITFREMRLDQ